MKHQVPVFVSTNDKSECVECLCRVANIFIIYIQYYVIFCKTLPSFLWLNKVTIQSVPGVVLSNLFINNSKHINTTCQIFGIQGVINSPKEFVQF